MTSKKLIVTGLAAVLVLGAPAAMAREGHGPFGPGMFRLLDADKDGNLSREEMQARAKERFKEADTDGDGFLGREEVDAVARQRAAGMVEFMFTRMDTDKDSKLSEAELMARADDHDGFERFDSNGDGTISREEFREVRKKMRDGRHHPHGPRTGEEHGD
ncbi:EF-hand domain-containing protein [Sulfitobacter sp. LCG007]